MKKSFKNIIGSLAFLNAETKNLIFNNKMKDVPLEIEATETHYNFIMVYGFSNIEQVSILKEDFRLWEMFTMFVNVKTAVNCMKAIAEGRKISNEFFDRQKNITPKFDIEASNFTEFLAKLDPTEKTTLKNNILEWDKSQLQDKAKPYFEYCLKNNGDLKTGDYLIYSDPQANESFFARVFQTAKNGWIMLTNGFQFFHLRDSQPYEKREGETIPKEFKELIDNVYNTYSEVGEEAREKAFSKLETETERAEIRAKKEAEKAEKAFLRQIDKALQIGAIQTIEEKNGKGHYLYDGAKFISKTQLMNHFGEASKVVLAMEDYKRSKSEETAQKFEELTAQKLETAQQIEDFVKEANNYDWTKDQKKAINLKIGDAKKALKTQIETQKKAEAKTQTPAPATATETAKKPQKTAQLAKGKATETKPAPAPKKAPKK